MPSTPALTKAALAGHGRADKNASTNKQAPRSTIDLNPAVDDVHEKLDVLRAVMVDNMQRAIRRGDELDNVNTKSEDLLEVSERFPKQADAVKNMYCRRFWKRIVAFLLLACTILALVIWLFAK